MSNILDLLLNIVHLGPLDNHKKRLGIILVAAGQVAELTNPPLGMALTQLGVVIGGVGVVSDTVHYVKGDGK